MTAVSAFSAVRRGSKKPGTLPELRDAQFQSPGARLPVPLAVALPLGQPQQALLAVGGTRQGADLQFHEPLGGKADYLAQQIGISCHLQKAAQVHHVAGYR